MSGALRLLVVATGISSMGNGLWLTSGVLFLVTSAGLAPIEIGLGLTVAGVIGVLVGVPIGAWADVTEPRRVAIVMLGLEATATAGYALVGTVQAFVPVATLAATGLAGSNAARGALLAGLFGTAGAARARGMLRAAANLGISVGTVLAGVVLAIDSRPVYLVMIGLDVLTFLVAAALYRPLPDVLTTASVPRPARRWTAVRDGRYLAVTAVNGVMTVQYGVLTIALPLWVATATNAPMWAVAPVFMVNTVICVLFQVRVARGLDEPASAARAARRSGWVFVAAVVLFALTAGLPPVPTVLLLAAAVLVHSFGELLQAAASFSLSFTLAAPHAHGQYQGVWGIGVGFGESAAPAILTGLLIGGGRLGWIGVGVLLAGAGLATPPLVRWASAERLSR